MYAQVGHKASTLIRSLVGFVRSMLYGTLLALSVSVLLVALVFGVFDQDTPWAAKGVVTVFGPFAACLLLEGGV